MENQPHVLVVEDDRETRALIAQYLQSQSLRVTAVRSGTDMRKAMEESGFSLLLLDLMLPGKDGLTLCRELRAEGATIPIIILTALGDEPDRITGLESGADDYLPKPFSPRELLARITAVLRRSDTTAKQIAERRLTFAGFILEPGQRRLLDPAGSEVDLTAAEYDLLLAMVQRPRRVLNRDQLLDLTRGRDATPFDRSIDVLISRVRRKLQHSPETPEIIRTVRSGGYVFAEEVSQC